MFSILYIFFYLSIYFFLIISLDILDDKPYEKLEYKYTDVECDITGDTSGIKEGAILYGRANGVLVNVAKEEIAKVRNKKLSEMIDEFVNPQKSSRFSSFRIKYVGIKDGILLCNIGFYLSIDDDNDDDDNDNDDDDNDDNDDI